MQACWARTTSLGIARNRRDRKNKVTAVSVLTGDSGEWLPQGAVAEGFVAGAESLFDFGNGVSVVLDQGFDSLGFGLHLQDRLLEVQVDRELVGELKRERRVAGLNLNPLSQHFKKLLMQLDHRLGFTLGNLRGLVVKEGDVTLQKGALLVELLDGEAPAAFGSDVQAPVVVLLAHTQDHRRAPDLSQRALPGSHHAEGRLLREALVDQFLVARLEDVQRKRRARE